MNSEIAIRLRNLGKCYRAYRRPLHRVLDLLGVPATGWPDGKRYSEHWALRGLDLEVRRGERLGIIGRNGAGKSTLLQIICGRLQASEGSREVHGQVQALLELGTGFYPDFTGRENIRASLQAFGCPEADLPALEEDILEFSELWDVADQPVKTYSSGMYTRLAFATATAVVPDILVIDEIFSAGDATFVGKSAARMKRLTDDEGVTVLFVTHGLALMERFCTRALLLDRGTVRYAGLPLDVSRYYSARVREEEELNLMVGRGALRKRALLAAGGMQPRQEMLFRLQADADCDPGDVKIRELRLCRDGAVLAGIPVGAPGDTAWTEKGRLLLDPGYLDWGDPQRDGDSYFRSCVGPPGRRGHSPFVFVLPEEIRDGSCRLELEFSARQGRGADLEWFHDGAYHFLGRIEGRDRVDRLNLALPACALPPPPETVPADARYGDGACRIIACGLRDARGREARVFTSGESLEIWFRVLAERVLREYVVTLCIYHIDTTPMCQVFLPAADAGRPLQGETELRALFSPLRLGEGEYHLTLAVYRECDMADPLENHAHCVLDRALGFRIEQPQGIRKSYGRFLHPVDWRISAGEEVR